MMSTESFNYYYCFLAFWLRLSVKYFYPPPTGHQGCTPDENACINWSWNWFYVNVITATVLCECASSHCFSSPTVLGGFPFQCGPCKIAPSKKGGKMKRGCSVHPQHHHQTLPSASMEWGSRPTLLGHSESGISWPWRSGGPSCAHWRWAPQSHPGQKGRNVLNCSHLELSRQCDKDDDSSSKLDTLVTCVSIITFRTGKRVVEN